MRKFLLFDCIRAAAAARRARQRALADWTRALSLRGAYRHNDYYSVHVQVAHFNAARIESAWPRAMAVRLSAMRLYGHRGCGLGCPVASHDRSSFPLLSAAPAVCLSKFRLFFRDSRRLHHAGHSSRQDDRFSGKFGRCRVFILISIRGTRSHVTVITLCPASYFSGAAGRLLRRNPRSACARHAS